MSTYTRFQDCDIGELGECFFFEFPKWFVKCIYIPTHVSE